MKNNVLQFAIANQLTGATLNSTKYILPRIVDPIKLTLKDWINKNLCNYFAISGHYDSYISKSCVSVLHYKYLSKKYGNTLMDVDPAFALCTASLDKVRKKVSCFPDLVNKTIAPGIYSLVMDNEGSKMIVIKEPIIGKDDRSENGVVSVTVHFITRFFFIGKNRDRWCKRLRKQIDDLVSTISKTDQGDNKIRYRSISASGEESIDLKVRPMNMLSFPAKESLLNEISNFVQKDKLYKELQIPHRFGILLQGKPGTGKTAFAFSLSQHMEMDCVSVNLDMFDKRNGDNAFDSPNTIYIIDEIDSQLVNRSEMKNEDVQKSLQTSRRLLQLLRAMDTMGGGSIVIATTNYPEKLDPALKRSGRFDRQIDMDDLDEKFARGMIESRGVDPDTVLKGCRYPINPAELEQRIVFHIMLSNNMIRDHIASFEELGLNEAVEEEKTYFHNTDIDEDDDDDEKISLSGSIPAGAVSVSKSDSSNTVDACCVDDDEDEDEDEE